MKFHYNKTTIQDFRKQLAIREKALPILKHKETALRSEARKVSDQLEDLQIEKENLTNRLKAFQRFWFEFPDIVSLQDPGIYVKKVVGVRVPEVDQIAFDQADISWRYYPAWIPAGIQILREVVASEIKIDVKNRQMASLNNARKKTTQKVNLYEKVQIPAYEEGIRKIRRFLEDIENISKAGQKIMKKKQEEREVL